MVTPTPNEMRLRQKIAANMAYYRKLHNMTQSELAAKISYSDKSVSKWECAEGVPDIYVLTLLADLFGVSVNDLLCEKAPLPAPPPVHKNKNRLMILLMSIGLVWFVATVTYMVLQIFAPSLSKAWYGFIAAIPASCIVAIVFTSLWWGLKVRFIAVSALVWSVAFGLYIIFPLYQVRLIFAVGAVLQVLFILWFLFQKQLKKMQKELFSPVERKPRI
ncbi:helix-turn-helix transcriptional regulator [Oscillospiraceae bacterium WX1]